MKTKGKKFTLDLSFFALKVLIISLTLHFFLSPASHVIVYTKTPLGSQAHPAGLAARALAGRPDGAGQ
jgi:hypothetical protein